MTFTSADDYDPDGDMSPNADPAKSTLRYMPFIFGGAFIYEPSTGHLSTTEEFGNVLVGNIGEYLPQSEVQEAIRQLGEQQICACSAIAPIGKREGALPPTAPGGQIDLILQLVRSAYSESWRARRAL